MEAIASQIKDEFGWQHPPKQCTQWYDHNSNNYRMIASSGLLVFIWKRAETFLCNIDRYLYSYLLSRRLPFPLTGTETPCRNI